MFMASSATEIRKLPIASFGPDMLLRHGPGAGANADREIGHENL